ncbi:hypothetical protein RH831_08905 [Halodesulfurarchaeum sp. HSR-GB]|uniref:hypothetical protein n=1 Tax=Halodesulfurarchaeum sp. HSR-GB TaxID=3074077 RepID=UPI002859A622|nr:hypothetical protein [Halodesulfurarchaeum sp. HSR-GB]MDR5657298.1 hypothetical protein [Halodesulfurarchaeum sp. HSR-GB]
MSSDEGDDAGVVHGGVEEKASQAFREKLREKEPSEKEKDALLDEHDGHLIRHTDSQFSEKEDLGDGGGIQMERTAQVSDTYCFTCEEWVGLSGVDLRGTPRSKADAFYYGGMPVEILQAKNGAAKTLNELAEALKDRLDRIENREEAYEFISDELEGIRDD